MTIAGPPSTPVDMPVSVRAFVAGRPSRVVWLNGLGGLTYYIDDGEGYYVKWSPRESRVDLDLEAERLAWAETYVRVPVVVERGHDDEGRWIVTRALQGHSAVSDYWRARPREAVRAVGVGLRRLHDTVPVAACAYSWRVGERRERAHEKLTTWGLDSSNLHDENKALTLQEARNFLLHEPPKEDLVVCHGDACAPNTLLDDQGLFVAHVDLGNLGVGDRWADLAVASWSTQWNFGPGFEDHLFDAYGTEPDDEKIRYYRLLWDLDA